MYIRINISTIYFYFLLLTILFIACNDDNSNDTKEYKVYAHLDSKEPLVLNNIIEPTTYTNPNIDVDNPDIATARYDQKERRIVVTPLKIGRTTITVKKKKKKTYKIDVIVEYEGTGSWTFKKAEHIVVCDADIKEEIELDLRDNCIFYSKRINDFYHNLSFEYNNLCRLSDWKGNIETIHFSFNDSTKQYEFSKWGTANEKHSYTFFLQDKSDVGVTTQYKKGIYSTDRTKEYQEKYPDKSIIKVVEEYSVSCLTFPLLKSVR